jgi:hypothetical protein
MQTTSRKTKQSSVKKVLMKKKRLSLSLNLRQS